MKVKFDLTTLKRELARDSKDSKEYEKRLKLITERLKC
jgi:hypothetical protein